MKKKLPTILSVAACIGVVATFIFTIKDSKKADELFEEATDELDEDEELTRFEIVKTVAPAYIPSIAIGVLTIACIVTSNTLNKKQQASLAAAYLAAHQGYGRYKNKVKDIYGREAHERILKELAAEKAEKPDIHPAVFKKNLDVSGKSRLFYDKFSDRYFESTIEAVMEAEYHLNRNYVLRGYVPVSEYYEFLGIEDIPNGEKIGWDAGGENDGIWWLDFNHYTTEVTVTDGQVVDCVIIDMIFEPCYMEAAYWIR